MSLQTSSIQVNVSLYGSLARIAGGRYVGQTTVELRAGACKKDLLAQLGIPAEEKGYLFINAVLCDVPGLTTDGLDPLQDGDHVGIFSKTYMWPYQYRDGVKMSEELRKALQEHGAMHNVYRSTGN
jgi:hypothetical protein